MIKLLGKNKLNIANALPIIGVFLLQLFVFFPTAKLSLFGDDWLAFWRFETIVNADPYQQGYTYLTYFLTPYGPQDIAMGLISKLFGYTPLPYYIISFILRFLLAGTVYFTVYKLFKNKLAAFASAAFMSITVIGLETTNWVFNMPSYLGVSFFVLFIYYLFLSFRENEVENLFKSYLLLLLALIIVPIRMHGVVPTVVFAEAVMFLFYHKKTSIKKYFVRTSLVFIAFWVVQQIGTSFGSTDETVFRITNGLSIITNLIIKEGTEEVVLFPISTFGNMIFPEVLWDKVDNLIMTPVLGRPRPFPVLSALTFGIYIFLVSRLSAKVSKKQIYTFAAMGLIANSIIFLFYKVSPITFSSIPAIGSTLVGMYSLIFFVLISHFGHVEEKNKVLTLTVLLIPIIFMLLPWFMASYTIFPANHRYMIVSAFGVSVLVGILFTTKMERKILILILSLILIIQGYVSRSYFENLVQKRDVEISKKIWSVVHDVIPEYTGQRYHVAYFEGDGTNGDVIHNNVFFGYPPRSSIEQKIIDKDDIPVAITTYDDLIKMVTKGASLEAHAKAPEKLPLDRVYAFKITGNSAESVVVVDITSEVRNRLKSEF